jgi:hypothetical protein
MYGLKRDLDLNFLKGLELMHVAVSIFSVRFAFDEDVAISVTGEFLYFDGQVEWAWEPEPGKSGIASRTLDLLGRTVEDLEWHEDGTLRLSFANGHRLTMLDNSREHESYDITRPGQKIIV